jgi:putative ABC transport system permease protein
VSDGGIRAVFLGKAAVTGLVGAVLGLAAGLWAGAAMDGTVLRAPDLGLLNTTTILAALLGAPLLTLMASWLPASLAARQDPAVVLREE